MKKNKMMRLAAILLVGVLFTTSVIGGTFAKYVTSASNEDTARVAKWNITMSNTGSDAFIDNYDSTVASSNGDELVAPGTTRTFVYNVAGAPETDYKVTFEATGIKDVILTDGTYTYNTDKGYVGMTQTVAADYYPINYYVTITTANGALTGDITDQTEQTYTSLADALAALQGTTITYEANEECGLTVTIRWDWPYYVNATNDAYDTILGDLMAGNSDLTTTVTDYSLEVAYKLTVTATQLD